MALVNEVKRTGTVTELSGHAERWGWHRRGKQGKVERGAKLMEGGTHSELMHSCNEAQVLTPRASFASQQLPALSISVYVDESGIWVSF